jgi:hypothetical protein
MPFFFTSLLNPFDSFARFSSPLVFVIAIKPYLPLVIITCFIFFDAAISLATFSDVYLQLGSIKMISPLLAFLVTELFIFWLSIRSPSENSLEILQKNDYYFKQEEIEHEWELNEGKSSAPEKALFSSSCL